MVGVDWRGGVSLGHGLRRLCLYVCMYVCDLNRHREKANREGGGDW